MRYCANCVMPDTKPGVTLDGKGWCNACNAAVKKRAVDWNDRATHLEEICERIQRENSSCYDCIVPVSGGKDSCYQVHVMKETYRMKVLAVNVAAHLFTTEGLHNITNMVEQFDCDLIRINLKPSVFKRLRTKAFLRQGEPNWPDHCSMFSGVTNMARLYDVPLIVWGEDIAVEFGGQQNQQAKASALDINRNDLIKEKSIDDWLDEDISPRDVFFYRYPPFEELHRIGLKSVYLGYFHFWDGRLHYNFMKERGLLPRLAGPLSGNYIDYDNIDEKLCEINIWFKYLKFGFWRATDQCCYDIWNQRMSREDAVAVVNRLQDEFPVEYFEDFLRFQGLSVEEFWSTAERFRNRDIWERKAGKWELKWPLV